MCATHRHIIGSMLLFLKCGASAVDLRPLVPSLALNMSAVILSSESTYGGGGMAATAR